MSILVYTDHTWRLTVAAVSLLIPWLWRSGWRGRPRQNGSTLLFGPSLPLKIALSLGMILFVTLGIGVLVVNPFAQVWWGALLSFGLALLAFFGWPHTIILSDKGVSTRSPLLASRQIPWSDVASVVINKNADKTTITGHGGIEIVHHGYHVAPDEFRKILRSRAPHAFAMPSRTGAKYGVSFSDS